MSCSIFRLRISPLLLKHAFSGKHTTKKQNMPWKVSHFCATTRKSISIRKDTVEITIRTIRQTNVMLQCHTAKCVLKLLKRVRHETSKNDISWHELFLESRLLHLLLQLDPQHSRKRSFLKTKNAFQRENMESRLLECPMKFTMW